MSRIKNTLLILLIIGLALLTAWGYDAAATAVLKKQYPRLHNAEVVNLAYENSLPASVVYAAIRVRSGVDASLLAEDGGIGLFRLTPEQYFSLEDADAAVDSGLLYEPKTNIRLGTRWLAALYDKYGDWDAVYAAMAAGEEAVDEWLSKPGGSVALADDETAAYIRQMQKAVKRYIELYETEEDRLITYR